MTAVGADPPGAASMSGTGKVANVPNLRKHTADLMLTSGSHD
jgi:hypothetical protein